MIPLGFIGRSGWKESGMARGEGMVWRRDIVVRYNKHSDNVNVKIKNIS